MEDLSEKKKRSVAWDVYLTGKLIDTVFFDSDCDLWYVRNALIEHDGYDPNIHVQKEQVWGIK